MAVAVEKVENDESLPAIANDQIVFMAEQAEKRIEAINKIKTIALKVTNPHDWVDESGRPYLQVSGAEKVARLFGISWRLDPPTMFVEEDGHFSYTYKGYFSMGPVEIEAIGIRSSRDPFFSKKHDKEIPPSEIDRTNVQKAAYTNCVGSGITRLLGIRNLTYEDLGNAGIDRDKMGRVEYNRPEMSDEAKDQKAEIRKMILEMSFNDNKIAAQMLANLTKFMGKDGKEVPGKTNVDALSEKAVPVTYGKVKKAYEGWQKARGDSGNSDGGSETESA
jgi:hypothetical protein